MYLLYTVNQLSISRDQTTTQDNQQRASMKAYPKKKHGGERKADGGSRMDSSDEKPPHTDKLDSKESEGALRGDGDCRRLKPLFEVGAAVTVAWWTDQTSKRTDVPSSWLPGVVRSFRCTRATGPYGPTRSYDIKYDDGDDMSNVAEHLLFDKEDYDLTMKNGGRSVWIGVKNEVDETADDLWGE